MTALTVPEVLRAAERDVAHRGLCKGDLFDDKTGRLSADGAINVAVHGEPWSDGMDGEQWWLRCQAMQALERSLDNQNIVLWNDRDTTTEADVRAALLAAAQRAEADQP